MWKTYALDPAVLADHPAFYQDAFGHGEGRLIHTLKTPQDWLQDVQNLIQQNHPQLTPIQRQRLTELLVRLRSSWIEKPCPACTFDQLLSFHDNAVSYQPILPLDGVISGGGPLDPHNNWGSSKEWKPKESDLFALSEANWREVLSRLLCTDMTVDTVKIIDPYFDLEKPSGNKILTLIEEQLSKCSRPITLEIYMGTTLCSIVGQASGGLKGDPNSTFWNQQTKLWKQIIQNSTLREVTVHIFLLPKNHGGGLLFHDRYLLTNKGGIAVGQGIEIHDVRQNHKTTSIHRLSDKLHRELVTAFHPNTPRIRPLNSFSHTVNLVRASPAPSTSGTI